MNVSNFGFLSVLIIAAAVSGIEPACRAEADWVWHNGNIVPHLPEHNQHVEVWVKIGYQHWVDRGFLYLTYDGTEPQGGFGQTANGQAVEIFWDHLEWGRWRAAVCRLVEGHYSRATHGNHRQL